MCVVRGWGRVLTAGGQKPALEELAGPLPSVDFLLSQALVSYIYEYEYMSEGVCVLGVCSGCLKTSLLFSPFGSCSISKGVLLT